MKLHKITPIEQEHLSGLKKDTLRADNIMKAVEFLSENPECLPGITTGKLFTIQSHLTLYSHQLREVSVPQKEFFPLSLERAEEIMETIRKWNDLVEKVQDE